MDDMIRALGDLLIRAIPTILLLLALTFFLKAVFFRPLERTLQQRFDATEGALQRAGDLAARTGARLAGYDSAIRAARAEGYRNHETLHREIEERRAGELAAARAAAQEALNDAKSKIAAEARDASAQLARDAEALSAGIAGSILGRSAA